MTQHIIPLNDLQPHEETTTCPCEPKVLFENNNMIVVHNSWDGREAMEEVNEIFKKEKL